MFNLLLYMLIGCGDAEKDTAEPESTEEQEEMVEVEDSAVSEE